jgi:putative membrane protein insertion efficiency factor
MAARAAALLIGLYRRLVSPLLPPRCKYEPSCSAYALEAIRSFGFVRGVILATWRILRCNPFSHGGYDPVEAQTIFGRGTPTRGSAA